MKLLSLLVLSALHLSAINAEYINPRHRLVRRDDAVAPPPNTTAPPPAAGTTTSTPPPPPPPAPTTSSAAPPKSSSTLAAPAPVTTSSAPAGSSAFSSSSTTSTTAASPTGPPPLATFTGIPPLSVITSGMPTRNPIPDTTTYAAGATPPISGAPVLPTPISVSGWPTPDQVPDATSPQVKEWLKELDGYTIPNISTTVDGSCASDPAAAADAANRGWWTCGGYTRVTDITACPDKLTWGVSFDDGPAPYTQYLLDYLTEKDITATFFVVGSRVVEYPQTLIEEYMSGHEISVHTWSHRPLTTLTNEQIVAELGWTRKAIKDVLGITPTTMRPPYGDIDDRVRTIALAMGMVPIMWTNSPNGGKFDTNDWRVAGGQVIGTDSFNTFEAILGNATTLDTGFIVLQHDLFEITVDLATGYTLPSALSHDPKFNLMSIGECQHFPAGNLYLETNQNTTFPYRNGTKLSGVDVNGDGTPDTVSGGGGATSNGTSSAAFTISAPLLSSLIAGLGLAAASLLL
ncbi:hypothetical protein CPB84DRAFT_1499677 [Gymnopilus junonius]|uniref:chitin deacetylase n=1 Tax=Gymnopilus junonius TaxID=109634 RepID=A0A9P5NWN5_GYMJU|nr:hypothetical protein CPB84DRAFT_1499677 [Gymnopilus junonius]